MKSTQEGKMTYAAPRIEFHALVHDIIMCSGNQNGNNGSTSNNSDWQWWYWWHWWHRG